jgi:hypothetical protein
MKLVRWCWRRNSLYLQEALKGVGRNSHVLNRVRWLTGCSYRDGAISFMPECVDGLGKTEGELAHGLIVGFIDLRQFQMHSALLPWPPNGDSDRRAAVFAIRCAAGEINATRGDEFRHSVVGPKDRREAGGSKGKVVGMDAKFARLVESLAPKLEELLAQTPLRYGKLPRNMAQSGVYLFTEGGRHLYVGRSNSLRGRYGRHCRPGATYRQAAFAFQLAREVTGRTVPAYRPGSESRSGLMLNPVFAAAFTSAKERIRGMDYQFVGEADQTRQALLEIYCAVVLGTPYNDFGTHWLDRHLATLNLTEERTEIAKKGAESRWRNESSIIDRSHWLSRLAALQNKRGCSFNYSLIMDHSRWDFAGL